ncbi:MAG: helical backbone metal receptor [Anaerolineae bacterium]|nr:helical backbone metal receptor [Anaerolineae bacterium]NUQ02273.1 ABC transporter substrate-binding protein [Anaerolineae bacterium]
MTDYQYTQDLPFSTPPRRVVSLVPSVTESLFELGMGGRLVGRTRSCVHPAGQVERVPAVGGTKTPDIGAICALQPDLIIANQEENRREDVEALTAAGLTVWVTFPQSVRQAFNLLWTIMYAFEQPEHSESVRQIERLADVLELLERDKPCRVFVPVWNAPLMTFNAGTFAHDLLRVCGGQNIFGDRDQRYPQVTLGEVEAGQPDVILLPSEPYAFTEAHIAMFDALDTPASRERGVRLVDGSLLTWHGTRIARALLTLPAMLCPSADVG